MIRLAHSSVVQFLEQTETLSDHARQFSTTKSEGHLLFAQTCLAYILYLDSSAIPREAAHSCPLFDYATHYWYHHVQQIGAHNEGLARLIEEALQTKWDIYRLVTYPNISTRYNPWLGTEVPTSIPGEEIEKHNGLCTVCLGLSYQKLERGQRVRHRTFASLVVSAHECRLCEMIRHALLQFGIARNCQVSSKNNLSLAASERISSEVDAEMYRVVGSLEVTLRMEIKDPFLLISCYCYFGRLHFYTNSGAWVQDTRFWCMLFPPRN